LSAMRRAIEVSLYYKVTPTMPNPCLIYAARLRWTTGDNKRQFTSILNGQTELDGT